MASKYPVKSGYKYSFHRTRLGEPLHQPGYEFDLTDPNCNLLKTEYNNLHDPHLKSFFYNKTRHSQLLSRGYITKDNKVRCSLQEFNQYNNYIHHRMIELNKQYVKEQEHIKKQIDSINRSNAKLMEKIHKREQYKKQLLKKMEKATFTSVSEVFVRSLKKDMMRYFDQSNDGKPDEPYYSQWGLWGPAGDRHVTDLVSPLFSVSVPMIKQITGNNNACVKIVLAGFQNWRKNDLQLLSQMRKEKSQKLQPIEEKKKTVIGMFDDSENVSSLSVYTNSSTDIHKEKTISLSISSETKSSSLSVTSSKDVLLKPDPPVRDLQSAIELSGDLADVTSPISYSDFSTYVHIEKKVFGLDTSKGNGISSTMSSSKETMIKSDLPVYDLQHFKDAYSMMFQKIFEAQSAYLSSVSGDLIEIVFDKITSPGPGHHVGFTPIKTVAKETLHDIRGTSPCRYLISRLEVMSTASEIVENALTKWHGIAVQKCGIQYEDVFEERTSFKKLYKFFICANNQEEMYKAILPIATESILESSEEIVNIVLAHLEKFAKSRFQMPFKKQSDSVAVASLTHMSSKCEDNELETRSLSDTFRPHEQSQSFLEKELDNLATIIDKPEHKVHASIQNLIKSMLNIIYADIDYDRRQEIWKKIAISAEEKFLLYKYLEENYIPSEKEPLRKYSRILLLTKSHESNVSRESFTAPDSEDQFFRAVIEEVHIPGMVSCLEDEDKHGNIKTDWIKLDHDRLCRGYFENVNSVSQPLDNRDKPDYNCFLLNMFHCDHLMHSQNEFNRPLKVVDDLVSETLIRILKDLNYPIPEHLYGSLKFPNNKSDDTTIKYQKDSNAILLPSDIRSFSHQMVEYILKMLYATSSYKKWKESFVFFFSKVEAAQNTYVLADKATSPSQEHILWDEIAQTVSAKIESFLLLKFKTYLSAGEIIDPDLLQSLPEMHTEIFVHTKGIVTSFLGKIAESISQQQTRDQPSEVFSKADLSITQALINSLLDHICNEQFILSTEECQPKSPNSHECFGAGCALHNVYGGILPTDSQKSGLLDFVSFTLGVAFKQIMETIEVKSLKCPSNQTTPLGFETDVSKCCQNSVSFLQTEIGVLSKCIVEDLVNMLCSAKQKMKANKSLLKYQGSVTEISEIFKTISNSILRDVFGKFRGFISLAVKVLHPLSKNISEEIYFPEMFDQGNLLYSPAEDPKRKLKSTRPKSNLYKHSKHLSHKMIHIIWNQLEKISNNIRHSLLEDEDVTSDSSSLLVFEVEQISLHSSFSQDEHSITFPQDTHIMQNIETNLRRNIFQKVCAHLKGKESVTPEIARQVKKVILTLFKQLLIDLGVPLKLTHSGQMSKFHQQLLSEALLKCNEHAHSSPFSDSEVKNLSGDILKILSDSIHESNRSELHDRTDSSNRDILGHTYGAKPINPVFTKLKNFVISKIITLFFQSNQKPSQSETKKDILSDAILESYARELADKILYQAEKHLHEQIKDIIPNDNFLPLSDADIADHIVSVLLLSLKCTYQYNKATNTLPTSGKEETQERTIKCNAMEIANMVEIIIRDTIDNLTAINLSNITLDICAKSLASSVLALIQRELEQERRFMYGGKKHINDKNILASEIVNIILQKFYVKSILYDTGLTEESYNIDRIYVPTSEYGLSPESHNAPCSQPELSALMQQVECVLHEIQTKMVLELKMGRSQLSFYNNQTNKSSSEYLRETCLGFSRYDIEFVAKDIIETIIAKLSKHLQDILCYPNLSYEEDCFMLLEPKDMPCFSEKINKNSCFVNNQSDGTNSIGKSFVEDCLLSDQLVAAVSDKTTAFAAITALKCKPHLSVNVKNENVHTFLARFNNTSLELESYSKDIVLKVLENIKPMFRRKLLAVSNMIQHEDIDATHFIDTILHELYFKYYSSSNVSEELSIYNECTQSDTEYREAVDHQNASTPRLTSSSCVKKQRFNVTGEVLSTSSSSQSDFENGEVDHPRASTPNPSSSASVNEQIRFTIPEVPSPTRSNTEYDTDIGEAVMLPQSSTKRPDSSPNVNEQRSYNIRLHFL